MPKSKTLYIASILWIAALVIAFNRVFLNASASDIPLVIGLVGIGLGWVTSLIIERLSSRPSPENDDAK